MATAAVGRSPSASPDLAFRPVSPLSPHDRAQTVFQRQVKGASSSDPMFRATPTPPRSFVPSPDLGGIGSATVFQAENAISKSITVSGDEAIGAAQRGKAQVYWGKNWSLMVDNYEKGPSVAPWISTRFPQLFAAEQKIPRNTVSIALHSVCKVLHKEVRDTGQAVLLGMIQVGGRYFTFNQSSGMAYLITASGDLRCLTDYVYPGNPSYPVPLAEEVQPGGIVEDFEVPLRSQPHVELHGKLWHAARGLGYPEGIDVEPIIDSFSPKKGDHLLMISRDCAQNVRRSEINDAWKKLQKSKASCQEAAGKLASWFEARASEEDPNTSVYLQRFL